MSNRSKISSNNAKDHWILVRRIAKATGEPVSAVRAAWLPRLKAHLAKRPLKSARTISQVEAESLALTIQYAENPQPVPQPAPQPMLETTILPEVKALPRTTTLQVLVEGDPSVTMSLLLTLPSVKEVWARKG